MGRLFGFPRRIIPHQIIFDKNCEWEVNSDSPKSNGILETKGELQVWYHIHAFAVYIYSKYIGTFWSKYIHIYLLFPNSVNSNDTFILSIANVRRGQTKPGTKSSVLS